MPPEIMKAIKIGELMPQLETNQQMKRQRMPSTAPDVAKLSVK